MNTRRRIRSIVVRVAVFLLLGAVVNVVVAWTISLMPSDLRHYNNGVVEIVSARGELWISDFGPQHGLQRGDPIDWNQVEAIVPASSIFVSRPGGLQHYRELEPRLFWNEYSAGWPALSLRRQSCEEFDAALDATIVIKKHGGLWIWDFGGPLPSIPIWSGFAINTLFYAAILWLLFAAPGRVRRWRRIRRGLCAKCAYPIGTSDVCTECGSAVIRRSRGLPSVSTGDSQRPAPPAGGASTP